MGRITIKSVTAGMVLAKDAYTFRKQLLLPHGATLTDKNIETMKAWGVAEVETVGCEEPTIEELDARLAQVPHLRAACEELDRRFSAVREEPVMMDILIIAKKQLLERV